MSEMLRHLQLNMSMVGREVLDDMQSSPSLLDSLGPSVIGNLNNAIEDITHYLNIHDFYSVHLLNYCEGYYEPTGVANAASDPSRNVTYCSNRAALFHFDPTATLEQELRPGVSLENLHWPAAIQDGIRTLEIASNVMVILYYIGIAAAGLAVIGSFVAFAVGGSISAIISLVLNLVGQFQPYNC